MLDPPEADKCLLASGEFDVHLFSPARGLNHNRSVETSLPRHVRPPLPGEDYIPVLVPPFWMRKTYIFLPSLRCLRLYAALPDLQTLPRPLKDRLRAEPVYGGYRHAVVCVR